MENTPVKDLQQITNENFNLTQKEYEAWLGYRLMSKTA